MRPPRGPLRGRPDDRGRARRRPATTPSGCCAPPARERRARSRARSSVDPVERLDPLDLDVPGDFSSAAPFLVAATLLPGSRLRIAGVGVNPTRTGLLDVLERMGARISLYNRTAAGGEPVGDIEVEHADLVATEIEPARCRALIDELPLFALAASMAHGESASAARRAAAEGDRTGSRR